MTTHVLLLLFGCLALFASAFNSHSRDRRFERSGSLTQQVLLDDAQFENVLIEDEDDDGAGFGHIDHEARIAAAIQAAVRVEAAPAPTAEAYALYRLRLATQARPDTCVYPCGTGSYAAAGAHAVQIGWLQGVRVTVNTTVGSFQTEFDNTTIACTPAGCFPGAAAGSCASCSISAPLNNNSFGFSLTATLTAPSPALLFTLSTSTVSGGATNQPLNVTRLTVETQAGNEANPKFGGSTFSIFSPTLGDYANTTSRVSRNGFTQITPGTAQYGCTPASIVAPNPNFDGLLQEDFATISNLGFTKFVVTPRTPSGFLVDSFGNSTISFTIAGTNQVLPSDATIASTYFQLGLENIPCTTRGAFLYDEIAIFNGDVSDIPQLSDPFQNPTFYEALVASTNKKTSNLAAFTRAVRLVAGRGQLQLRDAVLDRGPFSLLSHYSKFTPCFRVYPDPTGDITVFIGFGGKTPQRDATVVVAELPIANTLLNVTAPFTPTFIPLAADFTQRPQFVVREVVLANIVNPKVVPAVQFPITELLSDVSVLLDNCPAFTYFQ